MRLLPVFEAVGVVVHGNVDFGLRIVSTVVLRQTTQVQPQIKDYNADPAGLFESLLLP